MTETGRHDLELAGCTPEPLMAYLKALGILRLVSEQKDEDARGWWKNDVFHLSSTLDQEPLVKFLLEEYKPTPIVAPWAGGSGFFKKDNRKAVDALEKGTSHRIAPYAEVIRRVNAILKEEVLIVKPRDEDKAHVIRRYRRELPDDVVDWIDSAMVLQEDGQAFAPLLGSGGNDGRLDFTQNFMQRITSLGLQDDGAATGHSRVWLEQALFAIPAMLDSASVGQFAPGRAGGPNATQGMEGKSTDNPWDFVLMIEGTLLFAGAVVRRLAVNETSKAAFPFTVRAVAAGFDSPSPRDELDSRGELWVPIWTRKATMAEFRQMLGEGRAEVSGRPARDGADFARAAAGLGVDRGISAFNRVAFLKRSGKAFLATSVGRFEVAQRASVDLLREVDSWLRIFRSASTSNNAPPRLTSALRRIESAIFDFCRYGGAAFFQQTLVALGAAELELSTAEQFRDKHNLRPLAGLSSAWAEAADDGSVEFAIARAVASVYDQKQKIGPLRANLEAVDWKKHSRVWAETDHAVVWNAASLSANLDSILQRRVMDGQSEGTAFLPLDSRFAVPLHAVSAFLAGTVDDQRIAGLIWGLMLLNERDGRSYEHRVTNNAPLPRAYALLKLLFVPRPLAIGRSAEGRIHVHVLGEGEEGRIVIRPESSILPLLRSGRLGEACTTAMQRLRASGFDPMPSPIRGRHVRDTDWQELDQISDSGINPLRLAAALLIPIHNNAVQELADLVLCNDTIQITRLQ